MESKRQKKHSKLIQQEISDIFLKEMKGLFGDFMATVTHVDVSPDLKNAKIYLSFLQDDQKEALVQTANENIKGIRYHLGQRIRRQVRVIPEIGFYVDYNEEHASRMEDIFRNLDIPEEDDDEDYSQYYNLD